MQIWRNWIEIFRKKTAMTQRKSMSFAFFSFLNQSFLINYLLKFACVICLCVDSRINSNINSQQRDFITRILNLIKILLIHYTP